jgi:glycosyltransferase involved in cell wall biosynthesis
VLTFGWTGAKNLAALNWAIQSAVPAILATDSAENDFPRSTLKEAVKRRIVSLYSAGWAAGTRAAAYLEKLGMPKSRIVVGPVDTIDVRHFERGAAAARADDAAKRAMLRLPKQYFLSVSRLSPEKNIPGLVRAFAKYRARALPDPWDLVIVGDGPSRREIEHAISVSEVGNNITMTNWVDFNEMPAYYGLASAFILASTKDTWGCVVNEAAAAALPLLVSNRAGSSPELVHEGRNGFTFDPLNCGEIAARMWQISSGAVDVASMGEESRRIIAGWNPEAFAASLRKVTQIGLQMHSVRPRWIDRFIMGQLTTAQLRRRNS